ncbi:MAG: ABC transporter permease [Desulfobacterales bacterium]|nr:ABC transporter permease [Desulfobacterales bacterium]
METGTDPCEITFRRPADDTLLVSLAGDWTIENRTPRASEVVARVEAGSEIRRVLFDTEKLAGWDSGLLTFLTRVLDHCAQNGIPVSREGLPPGAQRLLNLAAAVPERKGARKKEEKESFLVTVGESAIEFYRSTLAILSFIGEAFPAFLRMLVGKSRFRRSDLTLIIQDCGAKALPIVSLISLLVGLILAFVGAIQLVMFGAQIYVAALVGVAMIRVMGAVMAGVIMAGRTGAAFAAQLGAMEVNEEIDALRTLGISPMEFLVLPRMLALALMMPLLCLYADLMGVLGGLIVGVAMLDISFMEYVNMTRASVTLNDFLVGLVQSVVFGILVALSGCLRGMQCGRSASAVGDAATSAVVTGIVTIVVATAIITIICNVLGV